MQYCYWLPVGRPPVANGSAAPVIWYGKIIPGIILGMPSTGAVLPLAAGLPAACSHWQCCTCHLIWQNNTRYYFGYAKYRCSTVIGQGRPAACSQWQCCTWHLVWQNNTRYYFGSAKYRCSTTIGYRSTEASEK